MPIRSFCATVAAAVVAILFLAPVDGRAQVERNVPTAAADDSEYGGKFFDQLRALFGRFRNSDLERAFQGATSIRCPELVSNRGEWRPVAFFNENRQLGDWYRATIEEVRSDLAVYIFKGNCTGGDRAPLQLVTKFPIDESIDAYNAGRIPFERIDVNVNPPVSALFDTRSETYTFDLPFLFLRERHDSGNIYSLIAPRIAASYDKDVTDHWDCKAVRAEDVTYQFIICRTKLTDRDPVARNQRRTTSFGSSAFFILSDGKEATSSVKLSFGGDAIEPGNRPALPVEPPPTVSAPTPTGNPNPPNRQPNSPREPVSREPVSSGIWRMPDFWSRVGDLDIAAVEFRLQFSPQTWTGKIGSPQLIADQKMSGSGSGSPPANGADYCLWKPGASRSVERLLAPDADAVIAYTASTQKKSAQAPPSITFAMKTLNGTAIGDLQCVFPRADAAETISFDRWINIVGAHVALEVRR